MKINKRGGAEPSLNFAIGMIIGITIILIIGGIVLKFWVASQQARESFDIFTEELLELKDGDQEKEVLFLTDRYNIVAFASGDLVTECVPNTLLHPFEEQMKKPVGCGDSSCICFCKIGTNGLLLDTDCQKRGYCKSLSELDYDPEFQYSGCKFGDGLFIPGDEGGLTELNYKREGNMIYVSEDPDSLYSSQYKDDVDSFNKYITGLAECTQDTRDCKCELDHTFLSYGQSIVFTENNITFSSVNDIILEVDTDLKLDLYESQLNEDRLFVRFIEYDPTGIVIDPEFENEIIVFDNPDEITEGTITPQIVREKVDVVQPTLYKKEGTFYFYPVGQEEDLPYCNSEQADIR